MHIIKYKNKAKVEANRFTKEKKKKTKGVVTNKEEIKKETEMGKEKRGRRRREMGKVGWNKI